MVKIIKPLHDQDPEKYIVSKAKIVHFKNGNDNFN